MEGFTWSAWSLERVLWGWMLIARDVQVRLQLQLPLQLQMAMFEALRCHLCGVSGGWAAMLGKCKAATESLCVQRESEGETTKSTSVCGVSSIKGQVPYRGIKVSKGLRVMGTSTSSAVTLPHFFCFTASAFTHSRMQRFE